MKNATRKLKIGFVLDSGIDVEDGVQQYILTLGRYLTDQGNEVHYIVGESERQDIENMHSLSKNIQVRFNGNRVSIPTPTPKKRIKELLAKENFDVLHVQVPYSPLYGAKFVKYSSKNTVIVGTFHIFPYNFLTKYGTRLLGIALRKNLKRFDLHISASKANQEFSAWAFGTNSIVVPNMVDVQAFTPSDDFMRTNNVCEILYLGRLTERKGCLYLLKALSKTLNDYPDTKFHLSIAGKGELLNALEKLSVQEGLDPYIDFLGFVPNSRKIELMQKADISVFPSYAGECFGIVLIEAMAARCGMVIGGRNPGYECVLGEVPGSLIDVKDYSAFSDLLHRGITDLKFRNEIYAKQQSIIGQYDYKVVGSKILELYKNCKSRNPVQ